MINHDLKCIFVEVPKTGSSSIRSIVGCPEKAHLSIIEKKIKLQNSNLMSILNLDMLETPGIVQYHYTIEYAINVNA